MSTWPRIAWWRASWLSEQQRNGAAAEGRAISMATLRRAGWPDCPTYARLAWLTGMAYPDLPRQLSLALLGYVPAADGSDVDRGELVRVPVTYTAPLTDPTVSGWPQEWYCAPTQDVTFAIPGNPDGGGTCDIQACAVLDDSGRAIYAGINQTTAALDKPLTLLARVFRVTAESPMA
jgi:hypothetical protein